MEDLLKNVPIAEGVIPEGADTFTDMAFYVCESMNESLFNLLDKAGFVDENSQVVEESVVTEGAIGDLKETVITFLKDIWARIKAFFEQVITWFKENCLKAKNFIAEKLVGDKGSIETFNNCPDTKHIGKINKYDFSNVTTTYKRIGDTASGWANNASTYENSGIESVDKAFNNSVDTIFNQLEPKEKAKKDIFKEDDKDKTKADISADDFTNMVKVITDFTDKATIQQAYTENKKIINEAVKTVKELKEKTSFKDTADETKQIAAHNKYIAKYASMIKGLVSKLTQYNSAVMSLLRQRYSEYHKAVYAIAAGAKRSKKTNESASFANLVDM